MNRPNTRHEAIVRVPLFMRAGIGKLVKALGPIKSKCGDDLSKSRLRLVWEEDSADYGRYARGEIHVFSFRQAITMAAVKELNETIKRLSPQYSMELEHVERRFGVI